MEEFLAAPHHSQYRVFLDESDQVGPLDTASTNRGTSDSRMVAAVVVVILAIVAAMQSQKQSPEGQRISLPPGSLLNCLAELFCAPKTMQRLVDPIIADMQTEHCKALAEGRNVKARWIRIRGYWSFWKAVCFYTAAKNLAEIWKISRLG